MGWVTCASQVKVKVKACIASTNQIKVPSSAALNGASTVAKVTCTLQDKVTNCALKGSSTPATR